eukprot:jgi/Bigna1/56286/estExt_Genewise1Plus.C_910035
MDTAVNDIWADLQALQDQKENVPTFTLDDGVLHVGDSSVSFMRTLRIPCNEAKYPLPPSLGKFRILPVDELRNAPQQMKKRGGVAIPIRQSEAMWLNLNGTGALQVFTGKVNAVSGKMHQKNEGLRREASGATQNYVSLPKQPWIDGYNCGNGYVRQFVGVPLGKGLSVEKQISGQENTGGIQLVYYPLKLKDSKLKFQVIHSNREFSPLLSPRGGDDDPHMMGLAAGGKIKQEIYRDIRDPREYDTKRKARLFVHMVNSPMYTALTNEKMPPPVMTAKTYAMARLPWFEIYAEPDLDVRAPSVLHVLKTFKQLGAHNSQPPGGLPFDDEEEEDIKIDPKDVVHLRDGDW